jgi:hypothetical protein
MRKFIILLILITITFPLLNQKVDKDKHNTKFKDVFDRRDDEVNYPEISEIEMYKEENKLKPLKKEEKIVWAYRNASVYPFL